MRLDSADNFKRERGGVGQYVCLDFSGDGRQDLAFTINGGGSGGAFEWVAYVATQRGSWRRVLRHRGGTSHLGVEARGKRIVITSPRYAEGDSSCCPTAGQTLRYYAWDGAVLRLRQESIIRPVPGGSGIVSADRVGPLGFGPIADLENFQFAGTPERVYRGQSQRIIRAYGCRPGTVCRTAFVDDNGILVAFRTRAVVYRSAAGTRVGTSLDRAELLEGRKATALQGCPERRVITIRSDDRRLRLVMSPRTVLEIQVLSAGLTAREAFNRPC